VILARKSNLVTQKAYFSAFVKATKKGYLYAKDNTSEAIKILNSFLTDYDKTNIDIEKSLNITVPFFGNESTCGMMKHERLTAFFKWLSDNQLENSRILEQTLFTNELFD
jgi:hypothetical protein